MPPVDIIGLDGMTQVSSTQTWSRRDGEVGEQVFKGPIEQADIVYAGIKNNPLYDSVEISRVGSVGTITTFIAEDQQTTELNDVWELLGREFIKDIHQHQEFNQTADQPDIALADNAVRKSQNVTDAKLGDYTNRAHAYYVLRRLGVTTFVRSQPILRRSVRTSDRGILDIAWDGVDRAWQLNNETGSPNPPADLVGDINGMPEADATKKQWLKKAPMKRQVTTTLYEVVFEWHYAREFSTVLYEGDSTVDAGII